VQPRRSERCAVVAALALAVTLAPLQSQQPRFFRDDPLAVEPETQDASVAQPWEIDLAYDLAHAYIVTGRRTPAGRRAGNVNTIVEVPDSSWFTNRIGSRPVSAAEIAIGPNRQPPPAVSRLTVIREKSSGFAAGFTARDAAGATWFVSFDAPSNPEGATGALMVATKLFWALGYNQVEYHLANLRRDDIAIDPKATVRRPSGRRTPMKPDDLDEVLSRTTPAPGGAYRIAAGRGLPGRILGGFRYEGTRPDDPNDLVEHQHRRELRALRVFGAWVNLTDMKAGNTLDTVVTEDGRSRVRHYLQDVGSTFGVGANGPHDWSEGWEYVLQAGPALRRLFSLGFALSRWQLMPVDEHPAIGRFEGDAFDPETWKPRAPVRAYLEMRDDDAFWAARRVMAFTDEAIRAAVATAQFSDTRASRLLETVLMKRRDRIGRTYLPRLNPIVEPALEAAGTLTFRNAAVDHAVATAPQRYHAQWFRFDNADGTSHPLGESTAATPALTAPVALPDDAGAFVRVDLSADHDRHAAWRRPIETYFRREPSGWQLVGLVRLPGD
jgi:hypothetical protein